MTTDDSIDMLKHFGFLNFTRYRWRVQSVGETETDLKYTMAPELKIPCQDPTSTASTLANIIHYLNA
jgi:hypothetical protein